MYRVTATWLRSGTRLDCTDEVSLGDDLYRRFATEQQAQDVANRLQATVAEYDLDPTTEYRVEEV